MQLGSLAANPIVSAIASLYGIASSINDFVDEHIESMKKASNSTVRVTGSVIEGAKYGFGIGYVTPVVVIAVGQMILGNPLSAVATVATGMALSNPVAMTCGAVGAIYYGWSALSDDERNGILDRIAASFAVGVELVKAVLTFVVKSMAELLSSQTLEDLKLFVAESAARFGRSLSDVTHSVRDHLADAAATVSNTAAKTVTAVREGAAATAEFLLDGVASAGEAVKGSADTAAEYVKGLTTRK